MTDPSQRTLADQVRDLEQERDQLLDMVAQYQTFLITLAQTCRATSDTHYQEAEDSRRLGGTGGKFYYAGKRGDDHARLSRVVSAALVTITSRGKARGNIREHDRDTVNA